jgi:hypothetical protein
MTPNQKNIVGKLFLGNLIVYAGLAYYFFGPPLPQLLSLLPRPTALAIQNKPATPRPFPPTTTPKPAPAPTLALRSIVRSVRPPAPPVVLPAAPAVPSGGSPQNPLTPGNEWQSLAAHAQAWYRLGNGGVHIDAALQAKPLDGMTLDVFAPGRLDQPIGQGTLQAASGSLVWAGGHWQADGDWLARVTNSNAVSIQYKLTSAVKDISRKTCHSYWENIGTSRVYWTVCDNQGD